MTKINPVELVAKFLQKELVSESKDSPLTLRYIRGKVIHEQVDNISVTLPSHFKEHFTGDNSWINTIKHSMALNERAASDPNVDQDLSDDQWINHESLEPYLPFLEDAEKKYKEAVDNNPNADNVTIQLSKEMYNHAHDKSLVRLLTTCSRLHGNREVEQKMKKYFVFAHNLESQYKDAMRNESIKDLPTSFTEEVEQEEQPPIPSIEDLLKSNQRRGYVRHGPYQIYINKGPYNVGVFPKHQLEHVINIGNIANIHKRENYQFSNSPPLPRGDLRGLFDHIDSLTKQYGYAGIRVGEISNEFLPDVLKRYGFTRIPNIADPEEQSYFRRTKV